jgi:hypothetical protein
MSPGTRVFVHIAGGGPIAGVVISLTRDSARFSGAGLQLRPYYRVMRTDGHLGPCGKLGQFISAHAGQMSVRDDALALDTEADFYLAQARAA